MRKQPPENNNPANPLFKVAALGLDLKSDKPGGRQGKLDATLNFQRSVLMTGTTKTVDDRQVTIKFELAIRDATLELIFRDLDGNSKSNLVKLSDIAHTRPVVVSRQVKAESKRQGTTKLAAAAKAKAGMKGTLSGVVGEAGGLISGESAWQSEQQDKRTEINSGAPVNISVTQAGNEVHWTIFPTTVTEDDEGNAYLVGEVFRTAHNKVAPACLVECSASLSFAQIEAVGSIYIDINSLIIKNVRFEDDQGKAINAAKIKESGGGLSRLNTRAIKERLMKQIIRKFLTEQGMNHRGAVVEICRANS